MSGFSISSERLNTRACRIRLQKACREPISDVRSGSLPFSSEGGDRAVCCPSLRSYTLDVGSTRWRAGGAGHFGIFEIGNISWSIDVLDIAWETSFSGIKLIGSHSTVNCSPRTLVALDRPRRRPLVALVLLLALGFPGRLPAASVTGVPRAYLKGNDHASYCSCGEKCRKDSCCCTAKNTRTLKNEVEAVEKTSEPSGPCLASAPCHDPTLPPGATGFSLNRLGILSRAIEPAKDASREYLVPTPSLLHLVRRSLRIERPPRSTSRV